MSLLSWVLNWGEHKVLQNSIPEFPANFSQAKTSLWLYIWLSFQNTLCFSKFNIFNYRVVSHHIWFEIRNWKKSSTSFQFFSMCCRVPQELTLFWLFQIGRGDKERSEKVKSPFFKKLFLAKVEFAKLFSSFFFSFWPKRFPTVFQFYPVW